MPQIVMRCSSACDGKTMPKVSKKPNKEIKKPKKQRRSVGAKGFKRRGNQSATENTDGEMQRRIYTRVPNDVAGCARANQSLLKQLKQAKFGDPNFKPEYWGSVFKPEYVGQVYKAARMGYTHMDFSELFGVTYQTIKNWEIAFPEFHDAITEGIKVAVGFVERSLFDRATGYSFPTEKISYDARAGQFERTDYIEHVPPDPASQQFFLRNRAAEDWKEISRVEKTGKDGAPLPAAQVQVNFDPEAVLAVLKKIGVVD